MVVFVAVLVFALQVAASPQPGLAPPPQELSRTTPQSSLKYFLEATQHARFDEAAYILDLRSIPRGEQAEQGPELARQLRAVLDRKLALDPGVLSDEPEGDVTDGQSVEVLGTIALADREIPVRLSRVPGGRNAAVWVFSRDTVEAIDDLYAAYGPGILGEHLPEWYQRRSVLDIAIWQWLGLGLALLVALLVGFAVAAFLQFVGLRVARRTRTRVDDVIMSHARGPLWAFFSLWVLRASLVLLRLSLAADEFLAKLLGALFILAGGWGVMRLVRAIADIVLERMSMHGRGPDYDMVRRGQQRQVETARTVVSGLVLFVAIAVALTQFEIVRKVGVSLLASAGVVGVVLGIAAQKSVSNVIAGIQISVAQPIRIGDRVRISGDIGWIEEITLTYVIMKTWDQRRRVLPITYFIENEFENWTLISSQQIGEIVLHVDFHVPVAQVRQRIIQFIEEDEDWDGHVADVIVRDTTQDHVILRATASSSDPGRSWALKCRIRERALEYLQELDGGRYLPRRRLELPMASRSEPHATSGESRESAAGSDETSRE